MSEPTITETLAVLRRLVDWNRGKITEVGVGQAILLNRIVADAESLLEYNTADPEVLKRFPSFHWFQKAVAMYNNNVEAAIDIVYNTLDGELTDGRFGEIDELLHHCCERVDSIPSDLLLAILTLTSHAPSDCFSSRGLLVNATRTVLRTRGEWEPDALKGLE